MGPGLFILFQVEMKCKMKNCSWKVKLSVRLKMLKLYLYENTERNIFFCKKSLGDFSNPVTILRFGA